MYLLYCTRCVYLQRTVCTWLSRPLGRSTCCTCCTVPRCVYLLYCTPLCVPAGDSVYLAEPAARKSTCCTCCTVPRCVYLQRTVCTCLSRPPGKENLMYSCCTIPRLCVPAEDSVYLAERPLGRSTCCTCCTVPLLCVLSCTVPRCVFLQGTVCTWLSRPLGRVPAVPAVLYPACGVTCRVTVCTWLNRPLRSTCCTYVLYPAVCTCRGQCVPG